MKDFIKVPYKTITEINRIGYKTFCLYIYLLLRADSGDKVITTKSILRSQLPYSAHDWTKIVEQLSILEKENLIKVTWLNKKQRDQIINIELLSEFFEHTQIKCDNERIFSLSKNGYLLFTVHSYLYARVRGDRKEAYPSLKKISKDIGMAEKTVNDTIQQLSDFGLIQIKKKKSDIGHYYNVYTVKDYKGRNNHREKKKADHTDLDDEINMVLKDPNYCPCLFIGQSANNFLDLYTDKVFEVENTQDIRLIVENYSGLLSLEGRFFVMHIKSNLHNNAFDKLLRFIEEANFPIILLSYYDNLPNTIMSRMKFVFKHSMKEVSLNSIPLSKYKERLEAEKDAVEKRGGVFSESKFILKSPQALYLKSKLKMPLSGCIDWNSPEGRIFKILALYGDQVFDEDEHQDYFLKSNEDDFWEMNKKSDEED